MQLNDGMIQKALAGFGERSGTIHWSESGVNSRSARVVAESGKEYFVKGYLEPEGDSRNRSDNEFAALDFLWRNGVRDIPQPMLTLPDAKISILGSVKGRRFRPEFIAPSDVTAAAEFYAGLQKLAPIARAAAIAPASEACFTLAAHLNLVERRLGALEAIENADLSAWIAEGLRPLWKALKRDIQAMAVEWGLDQDEALPEARKVLSSSDVGFHNILKTDEGKLVFIDWEYFGWDDPVKLASDFVLQPSVPMPRNLAGIFVREWSRRTEWSDEDRGRFVLYFPIFSFKWCLIVLNAFLPNRQPFLKGDLNRILAKRLEASRRLKDRLIADLKSGEPEGWVADA